MSGRDFMRNRHYYFLRAWQTVVVGFALVSSIALFTRDFGFDPIYQRIVAGVILTIALFRVLRDEHRRMLRYRLTLFPAGGGTLKQFGQSSDARWMSLWEMRQRRWRPGDIILGRPLPEHSYFGLFGGLLIGDRDTRHCLTIALTGAGKTTCLVVPNLLTYPGSAFVIDPKGELAAITAGRRGGGHGRVTDSLGQAVHILDPFDTVKGLPKARFNPIAELNPYDKSVVDHVQVLVESLVPKQAQTGGDQEYFNGRARSLLKALILHVISFEPADRHNLTFIRKLLMSGDREAMDMANAECAAQGLPDKFASPMEALFAIMDFNKSYNGIIANEGIALQNTAVDELSGILGVLRRETQFLDSPGIYELTKSSDFSLRDLKREQTTIYLCLPALKIAGEYKKLLTLLITLCAEMMEREQVALKHPVLFMFDEFTAYEYMDSIDKAFGLMRGMGMRLWAVVQDISQLQKQYPSTWQNIEANVGCLQVLGVRNEATAQFISSRLPTVHQRTAAGPQDVPMMTARDLVNEFSDPGERRQLFFSLGGTPALIQCVPYWELFPKSMYNDDERGK